MHTPSLFDPPPIRPADLQPTEPIAYSGFNAPHNTFLTWSRRRQLEYCAARDENSAKQPGNADMREFYLERAAAYREQM
jgi:hypothetical protein